MSDTMRTMESASVETVIQGHPRYKAKVYYHHSLDFGAVYFDAGVLLDRRTQVETEYTPGMLGISEAVYMVAEEEAFEVASI